MSFLLLKLMLVKGTAYEFQFRNTEDPIKQRIWNERMEPYIDLPSYPTVYINYNSYIIVFCCSNSTFAITHSELLSTYMKDYYLPTYSNLGINYI